MAFLILNKISLSLVPITQEELHHYLKRTMNITCFASYLKNWLFVDLGIEKDVISFADPRSSLRYIMGDKGKLCKKKVSHQSVLGILND